MKNKSISRMLTAAGSFDHGRLRRHEAVFSRIRRRPMTWQLHELQAKEWQATVGAASPDRGSQALAFLPNEFWIHTGDSIRWTFPTQERHTLTFLTPGQIRPPLFWSRLGVSRSGVQVLHPMESSFDGSTCVHSGVLLCQ